MAHTENTLKDLKKENLIALVLNLQNEWDKFMEKFCERLDALSDTVDNLTSKLDLVESCLVMMTKTVNDNLLNHITTFERSLHAQEQYSRRECLEIVGIPVSVNNKNLQATVCNIVNKIDVPCGSEHLEDCYRIKGDHTTVKFSSRWKSSEVLRKKKKVKNIDSSKFDFKAGVMLYINESLCPYYRGLWGKCKKLWLDKVIFSFYAINSIIRIKMSEQDIAIQ